MAEETERPFISRTSAIASMVAGLLHAGIAIYFWDYFLYDSQFITTPGGTYIIIGMFALGFVPVLYTAVHKCISPVLLVSILLIFSVHTEWHSSYAFGGPRAFGLYIFLWVGIVLLAGLAGYIEVKLKHREIV